MRLPISLAVLLLAMLPGAEAQPSYERTILAGSGSLHHGGRLSTMIRLEDGSLATVGAGVLRRWSLTDGSPLGGKRLGGELSVHAVRGITPDGKRLAVWADKGKSFRYWDIATTRHGAPIVQAPKDESSADMVVAFAASADRVLTVAIITRHITGMRGGQVFHSADVRVRTRDGKEIATLKPAGEILQVGAISDDGTRAFLVRGDGVTVELWDVAGAKLIGTVKVPGMQRVRAIAAFADGRRLLVGGECKWDFLDLSGRAGADGSKQRMAADPAPLCVVDASGQRVWKAGDPKKPVVCVALDEKRGRAVGGGDWGELGLYDLGGRPVVAQEKRVHVAALAFAGGQLVGAGKAIHRWSLEGKTLETIALEEAERRPVKALVASGSRVFARTYMSDAPDALLYDVGEAEEKAKLLWQRGLANSYCQSVAFGPAKSFALIRNASRGKMFVQRWLDASRQEGRVDIAAEHLARAGIAPGAKRAFVVTREPDGTLGGRKAYRVRFGVVDAVSGKVERWIDNPTGKRLAAGRHHRAAWTVLAFDAGGTRVAVGCRWAPRVWVFELATGKRLLEVTTYREDAQVAFAGERLVVASAGTVDLWDLTTQKRAASMRNAPSIAQVPLPIHAVAATPDAGRIAAASADGAVVVFRRKD